MAAVARNILVGFDGTVSGRRALAAAADLAGYASTLSVAALASGDDDSAEPGRLVREARAELLNRHVVARYLEPDGDPASALIKAARELRADLVVVGRAASTPWQSIVGAVGSGAPCDVLIVA